MSGDGTHSEETSVAEAQPSRALRQVVFATIGGEGLAQQAVRRLAEAIGLGLLKPGEQLPPETQLAESFGISSMTLREALAILREAGYLETRRGRGGGTFVKLPPAMPSVSEIQRTSEVTPEYLRDLTDYRKAITGEAAALAAERITDAEIEALNSLAKAMVGEVKLERYRQADAQFHILIATASRSSRLARAETDIQLEFNTVIMAANNPRLTPFVPSMADASNREHASIVRAIRRREPAGARKAVDRHLESSLEVLRGLGTPQIAPQPAR